MGNAPASRRARPPRAANARLTASIRQRQRVGQARSASTAPTTKAKQRAQGLRMTTLYEEGSRAMTEDAAHGSAPPAARKRRARPPIGEARGGLGCGIAVPPRAPRAVSPPSTLA